MRLEVRKLTEKVSKCEAQIAKLHEEIRKQPVATQPPAPPPPPLNRALSLPLPDPVAALFESADGRVSASIMRSKAPFSSYSNGTKLLTEETDRVFWAVRTLKAMNSALMETGSPASVRHAEIRRYFCSDKVRIAAEVHADELARWVHNAVSLQVPRKSSS